MEISVDQPVREIAIENPGTVRVFESLGIDYCCGGSKPLREACARADIPLDRALQLLASANADQRDVNDHRWEDSTLADLATHIIEQHHAFVRREAPRLETLAAKVAQKHAGRHPELPEVRDAFTDLAQELSAHMMKEENLLFPHISQMESAALAGTGLPQAFFGSVRNPVARMVAEHDDAARLLVQIRNLTCGFQPPDDACPSYRGLYHGLEEFERDLHRHIHLENNLLFPRAVELERGMYSPA